MAEQLGDRPGEPGPLVGASSPTWTSSQREPDRYTNGNVHFGESTNRSRHVPQAQQIERTTAEPEVDTSYRSRHFIFVWWSRKQQLEQRSTWLPRWRTLNARQAHRYVRCQCSSIQPDDRQQSTAGFASESLSEVETVSPALRSAILEGKDVNLACLLIPHFNLGQYSHYAGVGGCQQLLRQLSSDPRLNRNLTLCQNS